VKLHAGAGPGGNRLELSLPPVCTAGGMLDPADGRFDGLRDCASPGVASGGAITFLQLRVPPQTAFARRGSTGVVSSFGVVSSGGGPWLPCRGCRPCKGRVQLRDRPLVERPIARLRGRGLARGSKRVTSWW